jgi:hypothetical protein
MEQLADTLCEQFLHMAQDVAVRGGTPLQTINAPLIGGAEIRTPAPPLSSIRQYVEQMQFDLEEHQRRAIQDASRQIQKHHQQQQQQQQQAQHVAHRGVEYDFSRRLSVGETSASATDVPTMARHHREGRRDSVHEVTGVQSFLPPVLQSQRLVASTAPDSATALKGYTNAAPVQMPEGDLGVFDDTAGGRLRVAQQSRRQHAQKKHRHYHPGSRTGGISPKRPHPHGPNRSAARQDHGSQIVWTSDLMPGNRQRAPEGEEQRFDPDEIDGQPLLHVPNYNAVRTMLSDEHGLKVGHIQPLLASMHGHSFGLLDCMMDGNTRQLSSRRPPAFSEVEKRLRVVPDVTIGPSTASALNTDPHHVAALSKLTPRFQRQREKERAIAIADIMRHEGSQQHRGNACDEIALTIPQPPRAVAAYGDEDEAESVFLLPKPSPRDVVAQLATRRSHHRFSQ